MATERGTRTSGAGILRWAARVWSLLSLTVILAFFVGERTVGLWLSPTPAEWVGLLLFPLGVAGGLVIAWWREGLGGLVTIAGLAGFYLWGLVVRGVFPRGPYFALIAAPGLLFWLSEQVSGDRSTEERR